MSLLQVAKDFITFKSEAAQSLKKNVLPNSRYTTRFLNLHRHHRHRGSRLGYRPHPS